MSGKPEARVIMVQGTASHAGKSVLTAAFCRIFAQDGLSVAPFKAQNMSLNSFVTLDGGEIGRAQAVQAEAARVRPTVEMNPILLKPEGERRSQVVVLGKVATSETAVGYYAMKSKLWPVVADALDHLRREYDVVVIEGAGSPAEINLKQHEIVNMRVAVHAGAPVVLVGDIERGGVFASLVGTMVLLEPGEAALVKAFVINKFRGDPSLLDSGLAMLTQRTGVPVAGVLPYFTDIAIPEEDSLALDDGKGRWDRSARVEDGRGLVDVAVVRLPRIANFDDFDPLGREPSVRLRYVAEAKELGRPDLIIIPGSKSTMADLAWLRERGLADAIVAARRDGAAVMGICGGFQMLGRWVRDPRGVESSVPEAAGLGLLPVDTTFEAEKATHQVEARVVNATGLLKECAGLTLTGYEIHMGRTEATGPGSPFRIVRRSGQSVRASDGWTDPEGRTLGTYLHGLFHNEALRRGILRQLARGKGVAYEPAASTEDPDREYDKLADLVREHLDMGLIYRLVGLEGRRG